MHWSQTILECINSVLSVSFQSSTVLGCFLASWSSTYMKKVNDITDWLSQTTDISKHIVWYPGLWDISNYWYLEAFCLVPWTLRYLKLLISWSILSGTLDFEISQTTDISKHFVWYPGLWDISNYWYLEAFCLVPLTLRYLKLLISQSILSGTLDFEISQTTDISKHFVWYPGLWDISNYWYLEAFCLVPWTLRYLKLLISRSILSGTLDFEIISNYWYLEAFCLVPWTLR